jgi:tRNA dimethylallyltransferase
MVDAATALRVPPNDSQRIQRALEVFRLTGKPLSSLHGGAKAGLPFEVRAFALVPTDRAILHRRIEARFDAMLEAGLVDELEGLRTKFDLRAGLPSMRTVGYRQVLEFLAGEVDRPTLRSRAVAATRQLAKRQMTWLRSFPGVTRLDPAGALDQLKHACVAADARP